MNTELLREMVHRAEATGHPQFAAQLQRQLDRIDAAELAAYRQLVAQANRKALRKQWVEMFERGRKRQ
jgi:nitrate reductase assembly molybdenum cofactor insertion protein NarJ